MTTNILISIGNSDDKLTQHEWAMFIDRVRALVKWDALQIHGEWFSAPDSPWQNANWCVEITAAEWGNVRALLRQDLREIAGAFGQDSIAWTEGEVEFLATTKATQREDESAQTVVTSQ